MHVYAAPEVLLNRSRYDGKLADVWSSGVMLYAMLCCRYPFERPEDDEGPRGQHKIVQRIINCAPPVTSLLMHWIVYASMHSAGSLMVCKFCV